MADQRGARKAASLRRDAGVAQIGRVTRWAVAGAVVLAGVFSVAAAHALPGHGKGGGGGASVPGGGTAGGVGDSSGGAGGIQGPTQSPQVGNAPPVATSGGS